MEEALRVRGACLAPVVEALRGSSRLQRLVPPHLQHYFTVVIAAWTWYPGQDYCDLLEVLAPTVDVKVVGGTDAYHFFGVVGAQRDLKGVEDSVPEKQRSHQAGMYRPHLAHVHDVAEWIRRASTLRRYYYSAGTYAVQRTGPRTVHVRLDGFPLVSAKLCSMSTGYWTELCREGAFRAAVEKRSCRARGQAECVWELFFAPEVDVSGLTAFESQRPVGL